MLRFLLIVFALGLTGFASERPNILFIVADDLNCAIGPYGDPVAQTPNLDRLAARGLTFERAYCQQAVCNPSRSSFLTGLRPGTVGVDDLRKYFRDTARKGKSLVTFPQHFKNHGWFCQNIGKLFHNMGETQDRQSWSIDEVLFRGTHAADTMFFNTPTPPGRERPPYKAPVTESPESPDTVYRDGQIGNLAAAAIRDWKSDRALFLAVGFWRPHLPFVAPKKYWDLYDAESIPLPTNPERPKDVPDIAIHPSREIRGYGKTPKDRPFTDAEIRHYRHGYYASISFLDAQVGKILDALDGNRKLAHNTIVIFTSDHGFHVGEHSLWGKTSNFELDARVPLLIASPKHPEAIGKKTRNLTELVDLFPTVAALAGIESDVPQNLEGSDLSALLKDPKTVIDTAAFSQHPQPFYGPPSNRTHEGFSIRTDRWRYTEWRPLKEAAQRQIELYDHENDPNEATNLASDSTFVSEVETLRKKLTVQFP